MPPPAASAAATTGRVPRELSAPEQRPPALASHVSTRATPPIGPRLSPDVDRDAISPTGSSTTPETAVGAPFGSRRPARHGDPSARVPNTDTDDVPTDTRTPRAPMDTARSRHASAVYPFAMPPRSRRGHGTPSRCPRPSVADTRAPSEEAPAAWFSREASWGRPSPLTRPQVSARRPQASAGRPRTSAGRPRAPLPLVAPAGARSVQRRSPTRDNRCHDEARNAASTTREDGAGGKGLPATYAARIALTSHAATSGPIIGLNAPPVASASASASRSSRSVSSPTTRPGPPPASAAPSRDGCGRRSGVSGPSVTEAEAVTQSGDEAAR